MIKEVIEDILPEIKKIWDFRLKEPCMSSTIDKKKFTTRYILILDH